MSFEKIKKEADNNYVKNFFEKVFSKILVFEKGKSEENEENKKIFFSPNDRCEGSMDEDYRETMIFYTVGNSLDGGDIKEKPYYEDD